MPLSQTKATPDLTTLTGRDRLYRVPLGSGLYLQVTPSDAKSWVFRFRGSHGKQGSVTLGSFPAMTQKQARAKATLAAAKVVEGHDPVEAKKAARVKAKAESIPAPTPAGPKIPSLRSVAEDFYTNHVMVNNMPSSQVITRWTLDSKVYPLIGQLPIDQVSSQVMSRFLDTMSATPSQQNRIHSLMSKMFSWAGRRVECLEGRTNPAAGYEHAKVISREVRLTEDEIRQVGEVFRDISCWKTIACYQHKEAVAFLLLTGSRAGVVYHMLAEHRFPNEGLIRFPARYPGVKGARAIYLGSAAAKLLGRIPYGITRDQLQRSWETMRPEGCVATLHDLRRTFASMAADLHHDEGVIDALLGHSRGKIRDAYVRRADATLMAVAEEVSSRIAQLLGIGANQSQR